MYQSNFMKLSVRCHLIAGSAFFISCLALQAAESPATHLDATKVLWQIGQVDGGNAEFALAPKDSASFKDDGFFVVGSSDAKLDWPYVQPGPGDAWAGSLRHRFRIVFGMKEMPATGTCRLRLDLLDMHDKAPPQLRIEINGSSFDKALPAGGGDSIFGDLKQAKPYCAEIEFPVSLLKRGRNDISITNDSGSWFLYDAVTLQAPPSATLDPVADAAAIIANKGRIETPVREIIVVCKTHFDIGYTHRVKDLLEYYRTTMIDRALDLMDASATLPAEQQFRWTAPGWVLARVLEDWPGQTPERRQRLDKAMKSGKFVTHALPFTVESEFVEPEAYVRGFDSSSLVCRKYGLPLPEAAKMTDVPSHDRVLATVLSQAGVKFMHIGCNWPSGYVKYPPLFWWEGPDGSRVLTISSPIYGTSTALNGWFTKSDPGIGMNLLPPPDWPYKTWVAIIVTPDNSGPPSPADIKALFAEAAAKLPPGVKVRMGRMEDFTEAILAEKPVLPVVKGEAPDTWIHGLMCDPRGVRTARNINPLMATAGALNTTLRAWKLDLPDPSKELAKAYEQSLLYSEHTWGGYASADVYGEAFHQLPPDKFKDLEASWEDKSDYIRTADKIVTPLLDSNLAALAAAVKCDGSRVVVYNPLPWKRSGVVSAKTDAAALKDLTTGKIVTVANGSFLAADMPASGYKTFVAAPAPNAAQGAGGNVLENEYFKITLDPARGIIGSLVDKRSGREWIDATADLGAGQYLNERFDLGQTNKYCRDYQGGRWGETLHPGLSKPGLPPASQVPYRAASPRDGTLRVEHSAVGSSALMEMPGDPANHLPATTLRVTLYQTQAYVDLELTIHDKAKDNWPEADWLGLSFKLASPRFCVGRSLGVMNPASDILPGANRYLYAADSGVTLTDTDGSGVGLCSPDAPLISLDTPGCWKFDNDFVPKKPVVFFNLYNNQWNTNYRYWYTGNWSTRVRLWTFAKGSLETTLMTPALETRNPLLAGVADGKGGGLPIQKEGIRVARPGILVTAFGTNPDGAGTLLRLWEMAGNAGLCQVTLPDGITAASLQPVDLRGRPVGDKLKVTGKQFEVKVKAFAPVSFVIE
jgi:hypothetical protein